MIRVESGLKYDKVRKRSDILIYDKKGDPFMVIECKSPEIQLGQDVLQQVAAYSRSLRVKYVGITNGLKHFCWQIDQDKGTARKLDDFPEYS